MLTPENQEKIIGALLKRPENQYCSDCNGKSPCWVSLDFGVFVCMNCSGAHRALGPSITRVRSTKLDTWNKQWVENMKIGNSILNQYWEHELPLFGANIKPNVNSSLVDIKKYVFDKYQKKKYADPDQEFDPLTRLKKGLYTIDRPQRDQDANVKSKPEQNKGDGVKVVSSQPLKEVYKKNVYNTVKQSTMPFSREEILKKTIPQNVQKRNNITTNLLMFNNSDVKLPESSNSNPQSQKKFDFNFDQIQFDEKPKEKVEQKKKEVTFDNFLINLSNQSQFSATKHQNQTQPLHENFFMSPQRFVNSTAHYQNQHGCSQPSNNNPTQQLTMNIHMNMYPGVMNINMGNVQPSLPMYQTQQHQFMTQNQQQFMQPSSFNQMSSQAKTFQYNDFFTAGMPPPPPNTNGITLEVTMKNASNGNNSTVKKQKSWVDDWM